MATNNLMEARSSIPWSTICDAAKGTISTSLESKHLVKPVIEAVSSANTAAASSGSNVHFAHAAHVARHVARYSPRAARATHAADIKTFTETIRFISVGEETSNLIPTMSTNVPADFVTAGTSHHSVFATLGSDRIKVSDNHGPTFWIILIAVIGLTITSILINFLARWVRKRRVLSKLHASHQANPA